MSNVICYQDIMQMMIKQFDDSEERGIDLSEEYYWRLGKLIQWGEMERVKANNEQ